MTKPKASPRDYDEDLRIEPYVTEDMPDKEVEERFKRGVRTLFPHDLPCEPANK